jgi:cytochrome c oxidase cbb3-type subunit 2
MPKYAFLDRPIGGADVASRMKVLKVLGHPYSEEEIAKSGEAIKGKSELDALIAYLQGLGTQIKATKG